jgi:hypothetical protein
MRNLGLAFVGVVTLACGGAPTAAEAPQPEPESAPASVPEPAEPPAEVAATEPQPPADEQAQAASDTAPREVKYIQTPEGMRVEVSGVRFFVTVASRKVGGGFGVKVSVKAESLDDKSHSLLSTDSGPLAFAGSVTRNKQTTSFGDERNGESEKTIAAGAPLEFSRDWPAKGERPLANNDSVELDVGLWGVGDSAEARRPLRAFARVKARVQGYKGKATVEPPPMAGK